MSDGSAPSHAGSGTFPSVEVGADVPLTSGIHRPLDSRPGILGRYQLKEVLGEGGMGRVWLAFDPDLRREVAIKVLNPRRTHRADAPLRFVAEAQVSAQLAHPNIVPVHDMGLTTSGDFFMVMKRVKGRSFKDVLREGLTKPHRLLTMFQQVCIGVAYAHRRGVMHRDLKPSNVLVGDEGEILVLDWGIAELQARPRLALGISEVPSAEGVVMGTPGYMAPEQADTGLAASPTADVFSLGAMLYEILVGRRAFAGRTAQQRFASTLSGLPVDPAIAGHGRSVPPELADLTLRCLARDPAARPPDAGALVDALEQHFEGSRRREEARAHVQAARDAQHRAEELEADEAAVRLAMEAEDSKLEPWSTLDEKARLHALQAEREELARERSKAFAAAAAEAERALFRDPDCREAADFLAERAWAQLVRAESLGRRSEVPRLEERIRQFGGATWSKRLDAGGSVDLRTSVPARVVARPVLRRGLLWGMGDEVDLGTTPLDDVELTPGSWLLTLRAEGCEDVTYPVFLEREGHWDSGEAPVFLPPTGSLPPGTVYVPAGPFRCGGDRAVVDSLPASQPWIEGFVISRAHLGDGDVPARSVTARDAVEFARARAQRDGIPWRLPREREWEKAARGVDGRAYPWGDRYDPVLANNRLASPGAPEPGGIGRFEHDRSAYGLLDVAGNLGTICGDRDDLPDGSCRVRGGCFDSDEVHARIAHRSVAPAAEPNPRAGIRLAAGWPVKG